MQLRLEQIAGSMTYWKLQPMRIRPAASAALQIHVSRRRTASIYLRTEGNFAITSAWSNEFSDGMEHTTLSNYLRCPRLACLATECGEPEDSFVRRNVGSAIHLAREFYDGAFYTTAE